MKFNTHAINKTFQEITGFKVTNLSVLQFVFGTIFCFVLLGIGAGSQEKAYIYISLVVALLANIPATIEIYRQIEEEEREDK